MGLFGVVSIAPSEPGVKAAFEASGDKAVETSSAAATKQASRTTLVSMTQVKSLPLCPPDRRPDGPLSNCVIMFPACTSETPKTAARLARVCGDTLATKSFPSLALSELPLLVPLLVSHGARNDGYVSSVVRTSVCDWSETSMASALVTHPEHARQSVREIVAGGGGSEAATLSSVVTS